MSQMWLINTQTCDLEGFTAEHCPKYAILSHRWQEEEVTFQDMSSEDREEKKGWSKIQKTCEKALASGIKYVWIDTCCINKENGPELDMAIKSMYAWYAEAEICYVYLFDLPERSNFHFSMLRKSVWFKRGWTLQELLAPKDHIFFNSNWVQLARKSEALPSLERITGIDRRFLKTRDLQNASVAMKMCWAADRVTLRTEDMAYSLLGVFDVNIPLQYGERDKAFRRLQEEIAQRCHDFSVFLWQQSVAGFSGLFAPSPRHFLNNSGIGAYYTNIPFTLRGPEVIITVYMQPYAPRIYLATFLSNTDSDNERAHVFLYRFREQKGLQPAGWTRLHVPDWCKLVGPSSDSFTAVGTVRYPKTEYPLRRLCEVAVTEPAVIGGGLTHPRYRPGNLDRRYGFHVQTNRALYDSIGEVNIFEKFQPKEVSKFILKDTTDPDLQHRTLAMKLGLGEYGMAILLKVKHYNIAEIALGVNFDGRPFLLVVSKHYSQRSDSSNRRQTMQTFHDLNPEFEDREVVESDRKNILKNGGVFKTAQKDGKQDDDWVSLPKTRWEEDEGDNAPIPIHFPSEQGTWAFEGSKIEAIIALPSRFRRDGLEKLLKISVAWDDEDEKKYPCQVHLRTWNSTTDQFG